MVSVACVIRVDLAVALVFAGAPGVAGGVCVGRVLVRWCYR